MVRENPSDEHWHGTPPRDGHQDRDHEREIDQERDERVDSDQRCEFGIGERTYEGGDDGPDWIESGHELDGTWDYELRDDAVVAYQEMLVDALMAISPRMQVHTPHVDCDPPRVIGSVQIHRHGRHSTVEFVMRQDFRINIPVDMDAQVRTKHVQIEYPTDVALPTLRRPSEAMGIGVPRRNATTSKEVIQNTAGINRRARGVQTKRRPKPNKQRPDGRTSGNRA